MARDFKVVLSNRFMDLERKIHMKTADKMHSKKNHFHQQRSSIFQKIGAILFLFAFFIFQAMPPAFADITLRPEGRAASYRAEMSASASAPVAQQNIPSAQTSVE